jgi:hypothetical protein
LPSDKLHAQVLIEWFAALSEDLELDQLSRPHRDFRQPDAPVAAMEPPRQVGSGDQKDSYYQANQDRVRKAKF